MKCQLQLAVMGSVLSLWSCGVGVEGMPPEGEGGELLQSEEALVVAPPVKALCPSGTTLEAVTCNCVATTPVCGCPAGFVPSPDSSECVKETVVSIAAPAVTGTIVAGDEDANYYVRPAYLVNTDATAAWPFNVNSTVTPAVVTSAAGATIPLFAQMSPITSYPYWIGKAKGVNKVSIKSSSLLQNSWLSKSVCVNIPAEQSYTLHVGGDDFYQVSIDGKVYSGCTTTGSGVSCFASAGFLNQTLTAGKHRVELKYKDTGAKAALWFEIYRNNFNQILAAKKDADLNTIFTTKSLLGGRFDYTATSLTGTVCPAGYIFDPCATKGTQCVKKETAACIR